MPEITLNAQHREDARRLAEGISSTLTDDDRKTILAAARAHMKGLHEICESDASACLVAMALARILAFLQVCPLQTVSDQISDNMSSYALAAGALAGEYELPEPPAAEGAEKPAPSRAKPKSLAEQVGQYL